MAPLLRRAWRSHEIGTGAVAPLAAEKMPGLRIHVYVYVVPRPVDLRNCRLQLRRAIREIAASWPFGRGRRAGRSLRPAGRSLRRLERSLRAAGRSLRTAERSLLRARWGGRAGGEL